MAHIFSALIISATDIGQFDIMLVDTVCLKFLTVGSPKLLLIFLANLTLSICLILNHAIFDSTVVRTLEFAPSRREVRAGQHISMPGHQYSLHEWFPIG